MKFSMMLKLTIHVTNMFNICADTIQINNKPFFPEILAREGCLEGARIV